MVSEFSLVFAILLFNLSMVVIVLLRRRTAFLLEHSTSVLVVLALLAAIRTILPVEFPMTIVLRSYSVAPAILAFFKWPLFAGTVSIGHILLAVWIAGSLVIMARVGIDLFNNRAQRKSYRVMESIQVTALAKRMRLKKARIIISPDVDIPYVAGLFRAHIYLPVLDMSDDALEMVLKHEMAHFYLRDAWIKIFYYLLLALFWWNPMVHIFQKELDRVLELRCDAALTKHMDEADKTTYLETILSVVKTVNANMKPLHLSSSGFSQTRSESFLIQRFDLIIASGSAQNLPRQIASMGLVCILFIASFMVIIQPASFPEEGELNGAYLATEESSYVLINEEGGFELYIDDQFICELMEPMTYLPIYEKEVLD